MRLTDLLALSHVPRWSIVARVKDQTVSDHAFRCAVIARELFDRFKITMSMSCLWWCLYHDGPESRSADIPTPFKKLLGAVDVDMAEVRSCPWIPSQPLVDAEDLKLLELADLIEAYTFISRWGVGPHAVAVADSLNNRIHDYCVSQRIHEPTVTRVVVEILCDDGRVDRSEGLPNVTGDPTSNSGGAAATPTAWERPTVPSTARRTQSLGEPSPEDCAAVRQSYAGSLRIR